MAPKSKTQKMSLGDFLGDQSLGSWADEMEDIPVAPGDSRGGGGFGDRRAFSSAGGFGDRGFGGGDRGFASREQLPLPTKPPFTAHLGNLSYDVTESDVHDFFADCSITHVRIIEDKIEKKPKGFGYVEFASLEGLKKALDLSGSQLQGRNVKVTVAEPPKDRPDRPEPRVLDDWTRKGPLPDLPNQNSGRRASDRGGYRSFDAQSDAGSERGESRRRPPFESDGKVRDFGNWERRGPLSPVPGQSAPTREGGRPRNFDGPRERRQSPAWGEGRSQDGPRPSRTFDRAPPERAPSQAELDNQWRARMRPDQPSKSPGSTPETSTPSSPQTKPAAPAGRPKLNLQKRTVSEADPNPLSGAADSKASPFGAARPVDTARKEAEVAERKERMRKEAEEKAKEEKRKREESSKTEKENGASEPTSPSAENPAGDSQEKDSKDDASRPGYEILQRVDDGDENADEEDANGKIVHDKAVKPKEITKDVPIRKSSEQGSWRRGSAQKGAPADKNTASTAKELDSDGWSTVPKSNRGRGRGGARAIAS